MPHIYCKTYFVYKEYIKKTSTLSKPLNKTQSSTYKRLYFLPKNTEETGFALRIKLQAWKQHGSLSIKTGILLLPKGSGTTSNKVFYIKLC